MGWGAGVAIIKAYARRERVMGRFRSVITWPCIRLQHPVRYHTDRPPHRLKYHQLCGIHSK